MSGWAPCSMGSPWQGIRRSIGLSLPETYRFLTGDHGADAAEREFESHFLTAVPTHLTANTRLYPGVADTLAQLRGPVTAPTPIPEDHLA